MDKVLGALPQCIVWPNVGHVMSAVKAWKKGDQVPVHLCTGVGVTLALGDGIVKVKHILGSAPSRSLTGRLPGGALVDCTHILLDQMTLSTRVSRGSQ